MGTIKDRNGIDLTGAEDTMKRWQEYTEVLHKRDFHFSHFSSVTQLCLTLCDPMDGSTPGLSVHHQLLEFTQIHAH